jgi:thiol:disulfide interchange protein DsbD
VQATLNVGGETKASSDAALLQSWEAKVPKSAQDVSIQASWEKAVENDMRSLLISIQSGDSEFAKADFYSNPSDDFEFQGATESVTNRKGEFGFRKLVKKFSGDWPREFSGVLVSGSGDSRKGYEVKFAIGKQASSFSWLALLIELGAAFLGGLILNIMPCVLPVVALKVFSFVKQSGEEPRRARRLGLIYALGILVSFLVLAGFLIALQNAGQVASWGIQMQNKSFVLAMTILVTLVALNLFGVFEVTLGGGAMTAADKLAGKSGAPGAFFNGVLATTLAIPCTAPVLAGAVAFALTQSSVVILLIFAFVALGLAAPYVILTWNPKLLRFVPKPGPWMQRFKIVLGFPMLATVVWLYKLSLNHLQKSQSLWFGIFLVTLALAAWIWGEFVQRGSRRRGLAAIISLVLLASVGAYAATRHEDLKWQKWSQEAVDKARADGHPVIVDFTADWCVTCQVNLHTSIDIKTVREKLADIGAVMLIADYTLKDDSIGRELHRFGRDAVPLVVVFPKNPSAEPIVLPPALTPGIVLNALEQAGK